MDSIILVSAAGIAVIVGLVYLSRKMSSTSSKPSESVKGTTLFPGEMDNPDEAFATKVRFKDIEQRIRQDFPPEQHTEVANILGEYKKGFKSTVYSIILHEANGDIEKVRKYVKVADQHDDFRDLAQALSYIKSKE